MADLEIKIKTSADLAAAKASKDAIQGVADATASSGDAAKKVIQPLEEHGKHATILGLKHVELKKVVLELSREFPLLGEAAHLALNPQVGAAVAAVTALGFLKKAYEEIQEVMRGGDWSTVTGYIQAQHDAINATLLDLNSYERELRGIATAQQSIAQQTDNAVRQIANQFAWVKALRDAYRELAKAEIERDLKTGKITPEQAAQKNLALAKKKIQDEAQAEIDQAKAELAKREGELDTLQEKEKGFPAQTEADLQAVAAAKIIPGVAAKEYKRDAKALGRDQEGNEVSRDGKVITRDSEGTRSGKRSGELGKIDFLEEELKRAKNTLGSLKDKPRDSREVKFSEAAVAAAEEAFQAQEHLVANAEKLFQQWPDRMARIQNAINIAEDKLKEDRKTQTGDVTAGKELEDKTLPELRGKLKQAEDKLRLLVPILKKAEDTRADGNIQAIRQDAAERKAKDDEAARKREQSDVQNNQSHRTGGGDEDPDRSPQIQTIGDKVAANVNATGEAFVAALETISSNQERTNTAIWNQINLLHSRYANSRNP